MFHCINNRSHVYRFLPINSDVTEEAVLDEVRKRKKRKKKVEEKPEEGKRVEDVPEEISEEGFVKDEITLDLKPEERVEGNHGSNPS